MDLLKLPVGEKWYTSELKAHRLVLHRTTVGVDTVIVWPEYEKLKKYVPSHKHENVCPNGVPALVERGSNDDNSDSE